MNPAFVELGLSPYWVGVIGSGVVEFFALARACAKLDGHTPKRYQKPVYLATRFGMPFVAGTLPMIMDAGSPLIAFYLGASAPVIIDKLAEGVMPRLPDPDAGPAALPHEG